MLQVPSRRLQVDPDARKRMLRSAFGRYSTGVTVVTVAGADGNVHCMTVNSFVSLSLDPPLVMWALHNSSSRFRILSGGEHFGVSVLADSQVDLARRHSTSPPQLRSLADWPDMLDGCPVIAGAVAQFACRRTAQLPQGDHVLLVGQLTDVREHPGNPLLFLSGKFHSGGDLEPL